MLTGTTSVKVWPQVSRWRSTHAWSSLREAIGRISISDDSMRNGKSGRGPRGDRAPEAMAGSAPPQAAAAVWRALSVALVAAATFAIASTARTFSATVDEPAHLAAGMQWLSTGEYTYDLQHPPLG